MKVLIMVGIVVLLSGATVSVVSGRLEKARTEYTKQQAKESAKSGPIAKRHLERHLEQLKRLSQLVKDPIQKERIFVDINWTNEILSEIGKRPARGRHRYVPLKVTWHRAKALCEMMGGHLVTLKNRAEFQHVKRLVPPGKVAWLGASDEEREGIWTWVTGEPFDLKEKGVPVLNGNPPTGDMHHLILWTDGKPHDYRAGHRCGFVCEW